MKIFILLTNGKLVVTPNHCYMGANKIDLTKDTNTVYTHPSSIQCNASSEINSLKSSVSNGKSLIASAITGKGVSTASNATFQTMANNISSIRTGSVNMIQIQADGSGHFTIPALGIAPQWVLMWQRRGTAEFGRHYFMYIDFTCDKVSCTFSDTYDEYEPAVSISKNSAFYARESDNAPVALTADYMKTHSIWTWRSPYMCYENSPIWVLYQ